MSANIVITKGPTMRDPFTNDHVDRTAVQPLLMTAAEAARALAISERTLWTLTKSGAVRSVNIGRCVRYDPRDLSAWIDEQKTARDRTA